MGGSILGSEAIYQFLNKKIKKNLYLLIIFKLIGRGKTKKKILNLVISKSEIL